MFINAVYTYQMIGPCIFTDYTLDVRRLLDILGLLLSCDYYVDIMTTHLVIDPK